MSNINAEERIERARSYLFKSKLDEPTKDTVSSLLDAAKAVHLATTSDQRLAAMSEVVAALAIHESRQAVRNPAYVQEAIDGHVKALHNGKDKSKANDIPATRGEMIFVLLLRPWPWFAMAVAVFSPHVPGIIDAIRTWVGK